MKQETWEEVDPLDIEMEIEENVDEAEIEAMFEQDEDLEIPEDAPLVIDDVTQHEIPLVALMVKSVFDDFVAPGYTPQGIEMFSRYTDPEALEFRESQADHFILVAKYGHRLAGMIEIRDFSHISLLFVEREFQGRGIAKTLFQAALKRCHAARKDLTHITVNASPYALDIYKAMGFVSLGEEQEKDGIRFIPMHMPVDAGRVISKEGVDR